MERHKKSVELEKNFAAITHEEIEARQARREAMLGGDVSELRPGEVAQKLPKPGTEAFGKQLEAEIKEKYKSPYWER